jgi:hypothetical protein
MLINVNKASELNDVASKIINQLPGGALNNRLLPGDLFPIEELTRETLRQNLKSDFQKLCHTEQQTIALSLIETIQIKITILMRLNKQYQQLNNQARLSHAAFKSEQSNIFWLSDKSGEKKLKLKLAQLKRASNKIEKQLSAVAKNTPTTEQINLLYRKGQISREIELLKQKQSDRLDPKRFPIGYCVRSNPMAYTTYTPTPCLRTLSQKEKKENIATMFQQLGK